MTDHENTPVATEPELEIDLELMRPAGNRLFVEPVSLTREKTDGGIIIPEAAREKPTLGRISDLGPGPWGGPEAPVDTPPPAAAGDYVLFGKFAGTQITILGRELLILRDTDIIATIPGGDNA